MPLYLEIPDLEGPVADVPGVGISNVFTIESYSHGMNQSYGPEGAFAKTTGSANVQLFQMSGKVDGSTPLLMQTLAQNDHYDEITLYDVVATEGGELHTFVKIIFKKVSIADLSYSGFNEGEAQQSVAIRFSEIEWEIDPLDKETGAPLGMKGFQWTAAASGART